MTNILDRWNTHYARCHTITDSEALGQELAQEVERLREALKPFAFLDSDTTQEAWEIRYMDRFKDWVDFGDIATARAALQHDRGDE